MGTGQSGSPVALDWASRSSMRTACMATRPWSWLTVVNNPTTSTSCLILKMWRDQALSFPILQDNRALGLLLM